MPWKGAWVHVYTETCTDGIENGTQWCEIMSVGARLGDFEFLRCWQFGLPQMPHISSICRTRCCRNIRDSAAQSRRQSSAHGLQLDTKVHRIICRPRCFVKRLSITLGRLLPQIRSSGIKNHQNIQFWMTARATFAYFTPERSIRELKHLLLYQDPKRRRHCICNLKAVEMYWRNKKPCGMFGQA